MKFSNLSLKSHLVVFFTGEKKLQANLSELANFERAMKQKDAIFLDFPDLL